MLPHSTGASQALRFGEGKPSISFFCCAKPRACGKPGTSVLSFSGGFTFVFCLAWISGPSARCEVEVSSRSPGLCAYCKISLFCCPLCLGGGLSLQGLRHSSVRANNPSFPRLLGHSTELGADDGFAVPSVAPGLQKLIG